MTNTKTGPTTDLARRIVLARIAAGMDQGHVAKSLSVARSTVSAWEQGRSEPSASKIFAYARLTAQRLDWFAEAVNDETAPANAEAVSGDVRPKGLEPLTFWLGVSRLRDIVFWTRARRRTLAALDAQFEEASR